MPQYHYLFLGIRRRRRLRLAFNIAGLQRPATAAAAADGGGSDIILR